MRTHTIHKHKNEHKRDKNFSSACEYAYVRQNRVSISRNITISTNSVPVLRVREFHNKDDMKVNGKVEGCLWKKK